MIASTTMEGRKGEGGRGRNHPFTLSPFHPRDAA